MITSRDKDNTKCNITHKVIRIQRDRFKKVLNKMKIKMQNSMTLNKEMLRNDMKFKVTQKKEITEIIEIIILNINSIIKGIHIGAKNICRNIKEGDLEVIHPDQREDIQVQVVALNQDHTHLHQSQRIRTKHILNLLEILGEVKRSQAHPLKKKRINRMKSIITPAEIIKHIKIDNTKITIIIETKEELQQRKDNMSRKAR